MLNDNRNVTAHYEDNQIYFIVRNSVGGCITFHVTDYMKTKDMHPVIDEAFIRLKKEMDKVPDFWTDVYEEEISLNDFVYPLPPDFEEPFEYTNGLYDSGSILSEVFPDLENPAVCPADNCATKSRTASRGRTLIEVVVHLNDEHEWTRERIADWLDTLDADLTFKGESNVNY